MIPKADPSDTTLETKDTVPNLINALPVESLEAPTNPDYQNLSESSGSEEEEQNSENPNGHSSKKAVTMDDDSEVTEKAKGRSSKTNGRSVKGALSGSLLIQPTNVCKVIKGEIHNVLNVMRTDARYVSPLRFTEELPSDEHHPLLTQLRDLHFLSGVPRMKSNLKRNSIYRPFVPRFRQETFPPVLPVLHCMRFTNFCFMASWRRKVPGHI
jgi:hypothetical protein